MTLKFYSHPPKSDNKPTSMVVMLHGLGADGENLMDLAQFWQHDLPDTVFISPDAPFQCDMGPMGYQWFSLQTWSADSILDGVAGATPILNGFIDVMAEKYGVTDSKIALVGFSQGTMMALYAAPRRKTKLAGVLGYSGALVAGEGLNAADIHKMPIHLIHGDADTVVPVKSYHDAKSMLESKGFAVSGGVKKGLPHSIDEAGIADGATFLKSILK